jgi:hypothetical protein
LITELVSGDPKHIEAATKAMTDTPAASISACLEDLLIWTQNFALSKFTGKTVPERRPMQPEAVARVVERADGMLEIVQGGARGRSGCRRRKPRACSATHHKSR